MMTSYELCNLELDSSEEAIRHRLGRRTELYNTLPEEEALEKIAARERALQREREAKARAADAEKKK